MDLKNSKGLVKVEDKCMRDSPPACVAKCPAHVDAVGMSKAIANGDFSTAYKLFSTAVPFTRIISESCTRICESVCERKELGGSVQIGELEKASVDFGYKKNVLNKAFLPKKNEKIAIAGGGISGLAAAYYLRRKGFLIDIYEKSDRLGGKLKELISQDIIDSDISILFDIGVNVLYNTEVTSSMLEEFQNKYDAVYIAIGCESPIIYAGQTDDNTFYAENGIFVQPISEYSSILSFTDGKRVAISIERHLQNVSKTAGREKEGSYDTPLFTSLYGVEYAPLIKAEGERFSKDEAMQEGARCIDCNCSECIRGCAFLTHFKTDPKKFIREVRNCLSISVGNRYANNAINSCLECGFCEAVCPVDLNTGNVCKDAKNQMVRTGKMPPSTHDFALKDMEHSNGNDSLIAKNQLGFDKSKYVFFPGCQLGATAPELVKKVYADLQNRLEGGVGLITGCCGAIAEWAARDELFKTTLDNIKKMWEEMGKPEIITACPTCFMIFKENIPEMNVCGIWDLINKTGLPDIKRQSMTLTIHDACTVRYMNDVHQSIRKLLDDMGMEILEPEYTKDLTQCCGYGGLAGFTNRELSDKAARLLASQSDNNYLVYCVNCRDRLAANDKPAHHILELVYGMNSGEIKKIGWSERRINRERLKIDLLKDVWGEAMEEKESFEIYLADEVGEMIENRMILLSDIKSVIDYAEKTGKKLKDANSEVFIASNKIGSVTFWVWYVEKEKGYEVRKAYSHRMIIEGV